MIKFFVTIFLLTSLCVHASQKVESRSIMDSCEFVYRVEADLRVYPPEELFQIFVGAPLFVRVFYINAWAGDPNPISIAEYFPVNVETARAEWTFELMSNTQRKLYRSMRFDWGVIEAETGLFVSLSDLFEAQIGRDFGEPCLRRRGGESEFRTRQISRHPSED
jgi:hypothetical protein